MTTISTAAIVAALGAFYRANKSILVTDLYLDIDPETWTVMDGISDELPLPKLTTTSIVQPGNNTAFNPTAGAVSVGARILKVRDWKVDLLINPSALIKTWMGFTKQPGTRQSKIPLEQFIMAAIIKQIRKDIRMKTLYRGVYNAAGSTPFDVANGKLKLYADEITATNLTPIVTGVISASNVVDKLLLVHDGLAEEYKNEETYMEVNSQIFDWYYRKFSPVLNTNLVAAGGAPTQEGLINKIRLEGTNCWIKREPGLGTSQRVAVTTKANNIMGVDTESDYNNFEFQVENRQIKVLVDGRIGVQLAQADDNAIRVNDQA